MDTENNSNFYGYRLCLHGRAQPFDLWLVISFSDIGPVMGRRRVTVQAAVAPMHPL